MLLLAIIALIASVTILSLTALLGRGQWVVIPMGVMASLLMLSFFLGPVS